MTPTEKADRVVTWAAVAGLIAVAVWLLWGTPARAAEFGWVAPGSQGVRTVGGISTRDNTVFFAEVTPVAQVSDGAAVLADVAIGAGPSLRTAPDGSPMWDAALTGSAEFFGGLAALGLHYNTIHREGVGLAFMFRAYQFGGPPSGDPGLPPAAMGEREARLAAMIMRPEVR